MRISIRRWLLLWAGLSCAPALLLHPTPGRAQTAASGATIRLAPAQLQPDIRLLRVALEQLHPGLYRHVDSAEVLRRLAVLEARWATPQTLPVAYRDLTILLAGFRDGQTFANPINQNKAVRAALFARATCLPFQFRLIEKRMIVTTSLDSATLPRGAEVLRIDDNSVVSIVDTLISAVHADGANDANRFSQLEILGAQPAENFDVLYPLFYDVGRTFSLSVKPSETTTARTLSVPAVTAAARQAALARPAGTADRWHLDFPDSRTARLTLPHLRAWRAGKTDWRGWLAESFATISRKRVEAVILDVRQSSGGDDVVVTELLRYLSAKPVARVPQRRLWRVEQVPASVLQFADAATPATLKTLKPADFRPTSDGAYERLTDRAARRPLAPYATAFAGKSLYALCGPHNSAATFELLHELQASQLAILVGQPTGGNRRGTTAGETFLLRLPNTGLVIDVPMVSHAPLRAQPDEGLTPDDEVEATVEALRAGTDPELARVRVLLRDERTER